jgi:hypothetical protein
MAKDIGIGKAAETMAYYIKLAFEQNGGAHFTADMQSELDDAVEAFKEHEESAYQVSKRGAKYR